MISFLSLYFFFSIMQCLVCMTNVCLSNLYLCFVFLTKPIWIYQWCINWFIHFIFNLVYFKALTSCHFRYKPTFVIKRKYLLFVSKSISETWTRQWNITFWWKFMFRTVKPRCKRKPNTKYRHYVFTVCSTSGHCK